MEKSFEWENKPGFKYNFTSTQFPHLYNRENKVTTPLAYDENKANVNNLVQYLTPNWHTPIIDPAQQII